MEAPGQESSNRGHKTALRAGDSAKSVLYSGHCQKATFRFHGDAEKRQKGWWP